MSKIIKNSVMLDLAYSLVPRPQHKKELAVAFGNTQDIINEMLKTDKATANQLNKFAQKIKGPVKKGVLDVETTLQNVYKFVKHNIRYQIDELGIQEIKTPSSILWSRTCDCKGYAIFIRSILRSLKIKSQFKFAGYDENRDLTHVYVIVPKKDGSYTTLDGCMPGYNEEKPPLKTLLK